MTQQTGNVLKEAATIDGRHLGFRDRSSLEPALLGKAAIDRGVEREIDRQRPAKAHQFVFPRVVEVPIHFPGI